MKKNLKILLGGAPFGDKNYGEDAILAADVNLLRMIDSQIDITVLTHEPLRTAEWLKVKAFSRGDGKRRPLFLQHLKLMKSSDIFAFGGTTILSDEPNLPLRLILLAKILGKKVITFPCGMDPINSWFIKIFINLILNRVDLIVTRDIQTKIVLQSYGVKTTIKVAADQVNTLRPYPNGKAKEKLIEENIFLKTERPLAAISLVHKKKIKIDKFVKLCNYLIENYGYSLLFFPTQLNDPCDFTTKVMKEVKISDKCYMIEKRYFPEQILTLLQNIDFAISSRLHFLISCAVSNVPFIPLSRSSKIDNFIDSLNMEKKENIENITYENLQEEVDYIIKNLMSEKSILKSKSAELKRKALTTETFIKKIIYES